MDVSIIFKSCVIKLQCVLFCFTLLFLFLNLLSSCTLTLTLIHTPKYKENRTIFKRLKQFAMTVSNEVVTGTWGRPIISF